MRALLHNLIAGFKLATFQRVGADRFHVSIAQFVLLAAIEFGLGVGSAYLDLGGDGYFNSRYILDALAGVTLTLAVAAVLAYWLRTPRIVLGYAVAATALAPAVVGYAYAGRAVWTYLELDEGATWLWAAWWLVLIAVLLIRAVRLWTPPLRIRTRLALFGFFSLLVAVQLWWMPREDAWYPASVEGETLGIGRHEALLYQQTRLLDHRLGALQTQRPKVADLYFVGFAGYGWQDVFMKEVNTVRALFDRRFDTQGRSLVLINNAKTAASEPIASATALAATLTRVGQLVDPEEDVLFLFVTSHGSAKPAHISVDNAGLDLTQLTPERLKAALAATPIKWKVIVVSACYSGGFIPALRDDHTLVITASSAERNSFGCSDHNAMTDFGRAYFVEALNATRSFTAAFDMARKKIAEREKAEDLTPSQPQMVMGDKFAERWRGRLF
ncbi:MAG: C13 family peptidase [Gammaproteobacteria bacterium]